MEHKNTRHLGREPTFAKEVGLDWLPSDEEYLAPGDGDEAVDDALVRGYYDETLPAAVDERIEYLIAHFRDWHEASRAWLFRDIDDSDPSTTNGEISR
jgi:hypothetical protein